MKGAIPCIGIEKKISFRAKEEVILEQMVAKSVNTQTHELATLKHCGVPGAVKRKSHARESCFFAKRGKADAIGITFNCVGPHDRDMIPMVVVLEAPKKSNPREVLRSVPFILCGRRKYDDLQKLSQKMKPVLDEVSAALEAIPTTAPVPPDQPNHEFDLRANPPPTPLLHEEEFALFPTDGPMDYLSASDWDEPRLDFRRSRFVN